jgi:CheY-like chemotaxis protein
MGIFSKLFGGEPADPDKIRRDAAPASGATGRRILLVETSATVIKVIELTLKGDVITAVKDAAAARAAGTFDVAILNASTNDDAYDLCAELTARMPVLMLAASFAPFDEQRARAAGVASIISIPSDAAKLKPEIDRLTSSARFH